MRHRRSSCPPGQSGFSIVEVTIALALAAALTPAVALTISQVVNENGRITRVMQAVKNVENAGYWVSRDALSSQGATSAGFPLTLTRQEWAGALHEVTYSLSGSTLLRAELINGASPVTTVVARDITSDPALTDCQFAAGVLTVRITSVVNSSAETGIFQITLRPTSPATS